jgi:exodeoxyribonuclease V alpha subunit
MADLFSTTTTETIRGTVARITFHNPENGYAVLQVETELSKKVTVVGSLHSIGAGQFVECVGEWITDPKYGKQLKATRIVSVQPESMDAIEKYLGSGLFKGIGPKTAKKLVSKFGKKVFEIIENEPHKLSAVQGFNDEKIAELKESWLNLQETNEIMMFLAQYGITPAQSLKIAKQFGSRTIEIIQADPYRIAGEIDGIGFHRADDIAQKLGVDPQSVNRARAGIKHILLTAQVDGHCAMEETKLIEETSKLLAISVDIVTAALERNLASGRQNLDILDEKRLVYHGTMHGAETSVAEDLHKLLQRGRVKTNQIAIDQKAIAKVIKDFSLSQTQAEALKQATESKLLVITGGPGVGKTTLVKALLKIAHKGGLINVLLCAPTGRAAKRLSEATDETAKTIHRLLEYEGNGGFKRNSENPLETDLIIIDEASMIDIYLMRDLLSAIPSDAQVIFVGDVDQLPSVGPGNVLSDMIDSGAIPVRKLTEIFRQKEASHIVSNAHKINNGILPTPPVVKGDEDVDYFFVKTASDEKALALLIEMVKTRIPAKFEFDAIKDIQVLAPMRKGILGINNLNVALQRALNPGDKPRIKRGDNTFIEGDKVIQLVNDYDKAVFNGDVGIIDFIDEDSSEVTVMFADKDVVYELADLDSIALAYACSIHKSQGSEFPAVVLPLTMGHAVMLQRNLLYTGFTRAKSLLVLVGNERALERAVYRKIANGRVTGLAQRLRS